MGRGSRLWPLTTAACLAVVVLFAFGLVRAGALTGATPLGRGVARVLDATGIGDVERHVSETADGEGLVVVERVEDIVHRVLWKDEPVPPERFLRDGDALEIYDRQGALLERVDLKPVPVPGSPPEALHVRARAELATRVAERLRAELERRGLGAGADLRALCDAALDEVDRSMTIETEGGGGRVVARLDRGELVDELAARLRDALDEPSAARPAAEAVARDVARLDWYFVDPPPP